MTKVPGKGYSPRLGLLALRLASLAPHRKALAIVRSKVVVTKTVGLYHLMCSLDNLASGEIARNGCACS